MLSFSQSLPFVSNLLEFKEQVPNTIDFSVRYCEGSQQAKVWQATADDLDCMYVCYLKGGRYLKGGPITLWCDGKLRKSLKRITVVNSSKTME